MARTSSRSLRGRTGEGDEVLEMMAMIVVALRENTARAERVIRRADEIRAERAAGHSYREIAADGEPLIVTLVTDNLQNLVKAGSQLRRAHARALYAEGATLQEIGKLFGVSHQRISAIIHSSDQ